MSLTQYKWTLKTIWQCLRSCITYAMSCSDFLYPGHWFIQLQCVVVVVVWKLLSQPKVDIMPNKFRPGSFELTARLQVVRVPTESSRELLGYHNVPLWESYAVFMRHNVHGNRLKATISKEGHTLFCHTKAPAIISSYDMIRSICIFWNFDYLLSTLTAIYFIHLLSANDIAVIIH